MLTIQMKSLIFFQYFSFLKIIFISSVISIGLNATAQAQPLNDEKIKGMNFRGPYDPYFQIDRIEAVKTSNAEWIAFVPEATLDRATLQLLPDQENNFWSETIEANIQGIQLAKDLGFKVMLKPHIILGPLPTISSKIIKFPGSLPAVVKTKAPKDKTRGAKWRGTFMPRNQLDWLAWESSYEAYILRLAQISDSLEVDLFCIGTELKKSATKRPDFWRNLIQKVRKIYKGPITYSANWDEYQHISFWKELDYIAVNTYFPISFSKTPKVKKTIRKWKPVLKKLKKISKREGKQILLTEFGYRNVNYAGKRPWTHDRQDNKSPNYQAQLNLYEAFFEAFWDQKWIVGGFGWQWFHDLPKANNTTFSIQDKPALEVLQKWYK